MIWGIRPGQPEFIRYRQRDTIFIVNRIEAQFSLQCYIRNRKAAPKQMLDKSITACEQYLVYSNSKETKRQQYFKAILGEKQIKETWFLRRKYKVYTEVVFFAS